MMGCLAVAAAEEDLAVNKDELDDARWFTRDEVLAALERCQTEEGMRRCVLSVLGVRVVCAYLVCFVLCALCALCFV